MKKIKSLTIVFFLAFAVLTGCASVFVPKTHGIGWTLNWSNPVSYLILAAIIGVIIWRAVAGRKH